jgi:MFS family permease
VRDEKQRAREPGKRRLQLLDCRQVEVVGGLVENEEVHPHPLEERELGPGPLAGRQRRTRPRDLVGPDPELGQERPGLGGREAGSCGHPVEDRAIGPDAGSVLAELADHDARADPSVASGEGQTADDGGDQARLPRAVGPDQGDPLGPPDLEVDGAEPERPALDDRRLEARHHRSGPRCVLDAEVEPPALPGLVDDVEGLESTIGATGSRRQLLGPVDPEVPLGLVVVPLSFLFSRDPVGRPLTFPAGPIGQRPTPRLKGAVGLLGVETVGLPLCQVTRPAAAEVPCRVAVLVELEHRGDRVLEEVAVVGNHHDAAGALGHEGGQPVEAVEVEVVGRFVEQGDVEAGEHDRGQRDLGGLPAGQRGGRLVGDSGDTQVVECRVDAGVDVPVGDRHEAFQRQRVPAIGARLAALERAGGVEQLGLGPGDARPADQVAADRLTLPVAGLLGEEADGRARGVEVDLARVGLEGSGQDLEERRLAHAVRADDPEALLWRHAQGDVGEHHLLAASERQMAGDEGRNEGTGGCRHRGSSCRRGRTGSKVNAQNAILAVANGASAMPDATMRSMGFRNRVRAARPPTFSSLRVRNYRLFFIGQIISTSGTWMQTVAQGWLVLRLSRSGTDLGLITAARFLPMMVLSPWGGLIADRLDKRRILYVTQTLSGVLALVLAELDAAGVITLWMVGVIALALGFVNVFDNPTRQSFIAEMVSEEDLANAITLNSVTINLARVAGPAFAGALIATVGIAPCFLANGLSFGAVVVSLAMMRRAELYPVDRQARQPRQVREGLSYVRRTPELLVPLIMITVVGTLAWEFQVSLPLVAKFTFHGSAATYGTMLAFMGGGAVVGGLVTARRNRVSAVGLGRSSIGWGVAILAASAAPNLPAEYGLMLLVGYGSITFNSLAKTALQLAAVPSMRGRVMALWSVAWLGSTPVGGPIVGWVGQQFGARWSLVVGGVATFLAGVLGYRNLQAIDRRATSTVGQAAAALPIPPSVTEPAASEV